MLIAPLHARVTLLMNMCHVTHCQFSSLDTWRRWIITLDHHTCQTNHHLSEIRQTTHMTVSWIRVTDHIRIHSHVNCLPESCIWVRNICIESRETYDLVMWHIWPGHVTHRLDSRPKSGHLDRSTHRGDVLHLHTYKWVMSDTHLSHVARITEHATHMNELCHTYDWDMAHASSFSSIDTSRDELHHYTYKSDQHTQDWVVDPSHRSCMHIVTSNIWLSHGSESCVWFVWVIQSCHIWPSGFESWIWVGAYIYSHVA